MPHVSRLICEKVNYQTVTFTIIFVTMNGHTFVHINHSKTYLGQIFLFFDLRDFLNSHRSVCNLIFNSHRFVCNL